MHRQSVLGGERHEDWNLITRTIMPINTQLQAFYNAATPRFGPDWQRRFQLQFLFPR